MTVALEIDLSDLTIPGDVAAEDGLRAFDDLAGTVAEKSKRRRCGKCKEEFPLHPEIFHPDPSHPSGYSTICASCDIERQRKMIDQVIEEATLKIDHKIQERSFKAAENARGDDEAVPHLKSVWQQLMSVMGGTEGLAAATGNTYVRGNAQVRQRLLDMMARIGIKVTEEGYADVPLETMSAAELQEMRAKIEGRLKEQARVAVSSEVDPQSSNIREGELVAAG